MPVITPKNIVIIMTFGFFIASCSPVANDADDTTSSDAIPIAVDESDYRIITLLPKDAIPSIDNPKFYSASEADEEYDPDEMVLGVVFDGEARAYSVNMLSSHEIVNDNVAGRAIAVTW